MKARDIQPFALSLLIWFLLACFAFTLGRYHAEQRETAKLREELKQCQP